MTRTITLRVPQEVYQVFHRWAKADNRPLSNLIETAALRHLEEHALVSREEMDDILGDRDLVRRLRRGSRDARLRRGRMVG